MVFPFLTYDANIEGRKHEEKHKKTITRHSRHKHEKTGRFEGASV